MPESCRYIEHDLNEPKQTLYASSSRPSVKWLEQAECPSSMYGQQCKVDSVGWGMAILLMQYRQDDPI
ncbi:MAG: hypothetical protein ACKVIO_01650 [Phycisphaerales bacterium]